MVSSERRSERRSFRIKSRVFLAWMCGTLMDLMSMHTRVTKEIIKHGHGFQQLMEWL